MKQHFLPALALLLFVPLGAALAETPPEEESFHVVKPGETLGGVAARAKVPRVLIAEANGLRPPYAVHAGQRLRIPRTRHHRVKAGETGFAIAYEYGVSWRAIATANGLDPQSPVRAGQNLLIPTVLGAARPATASSASTAPAASPRPSLSATDEPPSRLAWPVSGPVRRGFAPRGRSAYHDGIDIDAEEGTAIRAAAGGRVIYARQGPPEYGLTVIVHHGQRWTTVYGFLNRITVREGDTVKPGESVGLAGHSGLAKADGVHFEVRHNREALNPVSYLPAKD